jgi:hypothetical protein
MPTYEKEIYDLINTIRNQVRATPMYLGGITASGGGTGGPPGGFVGSLPQTRVTFDLSESASNAIPSGASLVHNLNRIRYRIAQLEAGSGGGGSTVISGISVTGNSFSMSDVSTLDIIGNVIITNVGSNTARVEVVTANHNTTHQNGGSDSIKLDDLSTPDDNTDLNATITHHGLLPKLPNNSNQFLNGVGSWTTVSGATSSGGGHTIQDEGVNQTQRTNLNFIGDGVIVTDDSANDRTNVSISSSPKAELIEQLLEGILGDELFTLAHGINEFDLVYDNGYYHLFYTTYVSSHYVVNYKTSTTILGLETATNSEVLPTGMVCPSVIKVGSTWHMWACEEGTRNVNHYTSSNPNGTYTLESAVTGEIGDPCVRYRETDSTYYMSYVGSSPNWYIGIKSASSPNGPWTDLGYIFSTHTGWKEYEMDPAIFFRGDKAFVSFAGYDLTTQKLGIVELDTTTWEAKTEGILLLSPTETWMQRNSSNKIFNPVWLEHDRKMYFAHNPYNSGYAPSIEAGWGYIELLGSLQSIAGSGHIIQENGVNLTQRNNLNFIGNVTVSDNSGTNTTTIYIYSRSEVLMQDGASSPPVPLENEAGDDWVYSD